MTIVDRAYGSLLGSLIGGKMGQPAAFLTPNQIRWYYETVDDYIDADPELAEFQESCRAGSGIDDPEEMMIMADLLVRDRKFTPEGYAEGVRQWCDAEDLLHNPGLDTAFRAYLEAVERGETASPDALSMSSAGSILRIVPLGISNYYDPDQCVDQTKQAMEISHGSRPVVAAACAVAAAVAACFHEEHDAETVMTYAVDAAVQGEQACPDVCLPSVSRRIRMAKKVVDSARGADMRYYIDEMTGLFGSGREAYETVPLAMGLFYAAGGNPEVGIPAAADAGGAAPLHAAVCGALCGAFSGVNGIPKRWISPVVKSTGRNLRSTGLQLIRRV